MRSTLETPPGENLFYLLRKHFSGEKKWGGLSHEGGGGQWYFFGRLPYNLMGELFKDLCVCVIPTQNQKG